MKSKLPYIIKPQHNFQLLKLFHQILPATTTPTTKSLNTNKEAKINNKSNNKVDKQTKSPKIKMVFNSSSFFNRVYCFVVRADNSQ